MKLLVVSLILFLGIIPGCTSTTTITHVDTSTIISVTTLSPKASTKYVSAIGSIIECVSHWEDLYRENGYHRLVVNARITNIGSGDGAITFYCEVEGNIDGDKLQKSILYLKVGQQDNINFYYWAKGEVAFKVYPSAPNLTPIIN